MKKCYYIVKTSYDVTGDISIDESELEKALYAFITESKVIFNVGGAIRGRDIISILPDWKRMMGWNEGHKIDGEDWTDINRSIGRLPQTLLAERKQVVENLIRSNRIELIGKNLTVEDIMYEFGSAGTMLLEK